MKNKTINLMALLLLVFGLFSCNGKEDEPLDVTGEWKLVSAQNLGNGLVVKSDADVAVTVYVSFTAERKFELYQKLGEGRFRKYDGTYLLTGNVLTGLYGGKSSSPWGSSYTVSIEDGGSVLVMTPYVSGESVMRYQKSEVPSSVKTEALPVN